MKALYLGTDPTAFHTDRPIVHYPIIEILPRDASSVEIQHFYQSFSSCTHIVFTSKHAVQICCSHASVKHLAVFAIGLSTAKALGSFGVEPEAVAQEETQEGMVALLSTYDLSQSRIALPRSSLSRDVLIRFFQESQIAYEACVLYDTVSKRREPIPDLAEFDEIVFTSPSTIKSFLEIYGSLPQGKVLRAIGPITERALKNISEEEHDACF